MVKRTSVLVGQSYGNSSFGDSWNVSQNLGNDTEGLTSSSSTVLSGSNTIDPTAFTKSRAVFKLNNSKRGFLSGRTFFYTLCTLAIAAGAGALIAMYRDIGVEDVFSCNWEKHEIDEKDGDNIGEKVASVLNSDQSVNNGSSPFTKSNSSCGKSACGPIFSAIGGLVIGSGITFFIDNYCFESVSQSVNVVISKIFYSKSTSPEVITGEIRVEKSGTSPHNEKVEHENPVFEEYRLRLTSDTNVKHTDKLWSTVKSNLEKRAESGDFGGSSGNYPDVYLLLGQDLSQDISEVYMARMATRVVGNVGKMAEKLLNQSSPSSASSSSPSSTENIVQKHVLLVGSGGQTGNTLPVKANADGELVTDSEGNMQIYDTQSAKAVEENWDTLKNICAPDRITGKNVCISKIGTPNDKNEQQLRIPAADYRSEGMVMRDSIVKELLSKKFEFAGSTAVPFKKCAVGQKPDNETENTCNNALWFHKFEKKSATEVFTVSVWGGVGRQSTELLTPQQQRNIMVGVEAAPLELEPFLDLGANTTEENIMESLLASKAWRNEIANFENSKTLKIGAATFLGDQGWRGIAAFETQRDPKGILDTDVKTEFMKIIDTKTGKKAPVTMTLYDLMKKIQPQIHGSNPYFAMKKQEDGSLVANEKFNESIIDTCRTNINDPKCGINKINEKTDQSLQNSHQQCSVDRRLSSEFKSAVCANEKLETFDQYMKFGYAALKEQSRLMYGNDYISDDEDVTALKQKAVFREILFYPDNEGLENTTLDDSNNSQLSPSEIAQIRKDNAELKDVVLTKTLGEVGARKNPGWIGFFDTKERINVIVDNKWKRRVKGGSSVPSGKTFVQVYEQNARRMTDNSANKSAAEAELNSLVTAIPERNTLTYVIETLVVGQTVAHVVKCSSESTAEHDSCQSKFQTAKGNRDAANDTGYIFVN